MTEKRKITALNTKKDAAEATSLFTLSVNVDHIHLVGKTDEVPERMMHDLFVEQSIRECRNDVFVVKIRDSGDNATFTNDNERVFVRAVQKSTNGRRS